MIYIAGSGPAGVATAKALLERGHCVTMLDVGIELEPDMQEQLQQLQNHWNTNVIEKFKHQIQDGNSLKLSYGSDYPYSGVSQHHKFKFDQHVFCTPSFAKGGLSNVWGSFIAPYSANELADWPITLTQLEPYYQKILSFIPHAMTHEQGSHHYPIYTQDSTHYHLSSPAQHLLKHYQKHSTALAHQGITFGTARLAVHFKDQKNNCTYCGLCQYGCPYQLIYSTRETLKELQKNSKFTYLKHHVLKKIEEINNIPHLHIEDFNSKKPQTLKASQVFLACGALNTSHIMLSSSHNPSSIKILESQHFMFPAFLYKRFKNIAQEKLHTLCQMYLKINKPELTSKTIYLQIYTYMEHYEAEFKRLFKGFYPYAKILLKPILERMIVLQGYLSSEDSGALALTQKEDTTEVQLMPQPKSQKDIKALLRFLFRKSFLLGFIPIGLMLKISKLGRSNHYGGSFPMSTKTQQAHTDIWGRPYGYTRVHLVDASIFPSIPASSITLTIMANAYRIASECELYE
jgi:choline dehydrogenase-like flavoprotein